MADKNDKEPSPEHLQFMRELAQNVSAMTGGDKQVACIGDEPNGIYAILLCVNQLPDSLILMTVLHLISSQLINSMADAHNANTMENLKSPSKYQN